MKALPHLVCLALKAAGNSPGRNYLTSRGCSAPAEFPQLSASICTKLHLNKLKKRKNKHLHRDPVTKPLSLLSFSSSCETGTLSWTLARRNQRNPALKLWNAKAATILPMEPKSLSLANAKYKLHTLILVPHFLLDVHATHGLDPDSEPSPNHVLSIAPFMTTHANRRLKLPTRWPIISSQICSIFAASPWAKQKTWAERNRKKTFPSLSPCWWW